SGLMLSKAYAGAPIDSYFAPNISSDKQYGVGGWAKADLVAYLHDGGNMVKGSAFGPMAEVVANSTSKIPVSDDEDIADYLQTQTKPQSTPPTPAIADAAASVAMGAKVYAANCAGCHSATGGGLGTMIPNLAHNDSVTASVPTNVIGAVLNGLPPWRVGPAMPSFATSLSDRQIADVANYVRTSWGNKGTANATPRDVMNLRAIAVVPPIANMASDQFGCPHVSAAGNATSIANPGSNLLNIYDGVTPETMPNRTRTLINAIRAANSGISNADLTNELVAAYCPVIANQAGLTNAEKMAALESFIAGAQPLISAPQPKAN
ncbi:MAG TPA: cytochrome c, partial [Acidocella sp.]|nr:cytochrome c [Acidocella sp.]